LAEALSKVRLSRKERELQFRVNLVLDAAEEVFAESTYAQASVEEIARRAEISVGTLYNLFHSKEDIYRGVLSRSQDMFFKNLEQRLEGARGPKDKIHVIVGYFFEHFSKYSRQFRHYVSATNGFQWELKSKLEQDAFEAQQSFMRRLVEICQRGMDEGMFKKGLPAELMAVTLLGIPHSFLMVWLEQEGVDLMSLVPSALLVADRVTGADNV
jgi:TetR/AcrR family transcriptional regulator